MSENIDWSVKVGLATAVGAVVSGGAVTAEEDSGYMIEEITVTANKQGSVSVQDLATSVQAIGEEDLKRAQLFSVEDYSRFIPSMSYMGNSSGAGKIFFRGVADAPDTFIAGSSAAVYLDEQPLTQSAQVDVRLIDMAQHFRHATHGLTPSLDIRCHHARGSVCIRKKERNRKNGITFGEVFEQDGRPIHEPKDLGGSATSVETLFVDDPHGGIFLI